MNIQKGPIQCPQKVVIYGPEGVGKTTLAASFPSPLFIDTEASTKQLDVARITAKTWAEIEEPFTKAASLSEFSTLVLDTVDWAARILQARVCVDHKKASIEDFGFGKGYTLVAEEFTKFLNLCTKATECGKTIVFLAHSHVKRYDSPEASYDRYELKMHKQIAHLLMEAADAVLFANYRTTITEESNGKTRAVGGKERVLYTSHTAAWDAKNRHNLPERIGMEIGNLGNLLRGAEGKSNGSQASAGNSEDKKSRSALDGINPWDVLLAGKTAGQKEKVTAGAIRRQWIAEGATYKDISAEILQRAQANPEKFFAAFGI
jgi:hypothetical protein